MRCAVTGGEGFIGKHVVRALREAGHDVSIIDLRNPDHPLDICDTASLIDAFERIKPQVVFHLAAIADARKALEDPVKAVTVNVGGTSSVLEASRHTGVKRVILASTCWVGNAMGSGILDEASPFQSEGGGHVYTTTKIASEFLAHDFHKLYGTSYTILRYGIPYGPGMWPGLVLRSFLEQAFAKKPLVIFGDGSATRRFLYVEDLAQAHLLAMKNVARNQTYNLEGSRFVTIQELAELVSRLLGGVEISYREEPTRVGEFQYFRKFILANKAHVDLGWQPKTELEAGVRKTIEWFRRQFVEKVPTASLKGAG